MARENENVNAQGIRDLKRTFIAFKRAEASSRGSRRIKMQLSERGGNGSQKSFFRGVGDFVHGFMRGAGQARQHHVGF
jgi:hypothetical protein